MTKNDPIRFSTIAVALTAVFLLSGFIFNTWHSQNSNAKEFNSFSWKVDDKQDRGEMLASLLAWPDASATDYTCSKTDIPKASILHHASFSEIERLLGKPFAVRESKVGGQIEIARYDLGSRGHTLKGPFTLRLWFDSDGKLTKFSIVS